MTSPNCPSCGVAMKLGFIPDLTGRSISSVPSWTEGAPKESFWMGIDLKDKERIPITTWRCPKCGLLLSYAR